MLFTLLYFTILGGTKFPSLWICNVCWCYSCQSSQISASGNFAFFWRVRCLVCDMEYTWRITVFCFFSMLGLYMEDNSFCFFNALCLLASSYNGNACWYVCYFFREKLNSMNLLLYMAPIAVVLLLPATLYMEQNVVGITLALAKDDIKIVWYLLFNSALAYFVNLTNFLVTKHTSALTLQVSPAKLQFTV